MSRRGKKVLRGGMGVNLKELMAGLPADYRAQVLKQIGKPTEAKAMPVKGKPVTSKMSKTEAEYERRFLQGTGARFEGITFRMANGHRYTPDFVYWANGRMVCVEVKGSYRLGSYQRARLAFDQARVEYPDVVFVWVTQDKDGTWKTKE